MKNLISTRLSGTILIISFVLLFIFHVLVILGIIPYEIIWGGQLKDPSSLILYEGLALVLIIIFILIVTVKTGYIKFSKFRIAVNIAVWIICIYFLLNTIGNLSSGISAEKMIFAPVSILITFFAFMLATGKTQ